MRVLFILNDAPYGSERAYNGLRLAYALAKRDDTEVRVFLFGDAVGRAEDGQRVPDGHYNVAGVLSALGRPGTETGLCGTCMDAPGIANDRLVPGAERSSLDALADPTSWAEQVLVF